MADDLGRLPVDQVAAWYRRLANMIAAKKVQDLDGQDHVPLSALLLGHYLDNRDPHSTFTFEAPGYLKGMLQVMSVLAYHRAVFLSQKAGPTGAIGGIAPRVRGDAPFVKWQPPTVLDLHVGSLVQTAAGYLDIGRIQLSGTAQERDIFTALDGFQLRSEAMVKSEGNTDSHHIKVSFVTWFSMVKDRYDWDYNKYLTLPNPDYQSKAPGAVLPNNRSIEVHHSNARRLEQANLAAPYNVASNRWRVSDTSISGPATVPF
jgi:hypothetical protein